MAELMSPRNVENPPAISGKSVENPGPLPGNNPQPTVRPMLPGAKPLFDIIFASFMRNLTTGQLDDDMYVESIVRQSIKLANRIVEKFPELSNLIPIPKPILPENWKASTQK